MRYLLLLLAFVISGSISAQWVNYGAEIQENHSTFCENYFAPLFQDSSLVTNFSGELLPVWMYSLGQVFDPTSEFLDQSEVGVLSEEQPYRVDSVSFDFNYHRVQSGADTLYIQFFTEDQFYLYPQPWPDWSGMEDVSRAGLSYSPDINRSPDALLEIMEVLDDEDATGNDLGTKSYYIGVDVPAGQKIAATVTYATGNSYSLGDTMTYNYSDNEVIDQVNEFVMRYYSDYDRLRETEVYNHAFVASYAARYSDNSNGWADQYWSGLATGLNNGFFHADISFHLTVLNDVSITEQESDIQLSLSPNPASEFVRLRTDYKAQGQLELRIMDASGRVVYTGGQRQNSLDGHEIDVSSLQSGVYFLSIKDELVLENRTFIITR